MRMSYACMNVEQRKEFEPRYNRLYAERRRVLSKFNAALFDSSVEPEEFDKIYAKLRDVEDKLFDIKLEARKIKWAI